MPLAVLSILNDAEISEDEVVRCVKDMLSETREQLRFDLVMYRATDVRPCALCNAVAALTVGTGCFARLG